MAENEDSAVLATALPAKRSGRLIGAILVDAGRLKAENVEHILRAQREKGLRFGETAIQLRLLTPDDVEFALSRQFDFPYVQQGVNVLGGEVATAYTPFGPKVEALRAIRSRLMQRWFDAEPKHKSLAVISAQRGEGRSFVAANLAVMLSQIGRRTLLVDADLRNPALHRLFDLGNGPGLAEALTGRGGIEMIRPIGILQHLAVLPAGAEPPNPGDLLARPLFAQLLLELEDKFDCIVVDTPAAIEFADAHIVASRTGGAIIVARKNVSRVNQIRAVAIGLTDARATMVGTVLNDY